MIYEFFFNELDGYISEYDLKVEYAPKEDQVRNIYVDLGPIYATYVLPIVTTKAFRKLVVISFYFLNRNVEKIPS